MLQAFVDDSVSSQGEQRLYLSAYINTAEKWAAFSDHWGAALKQHPAIDYFKAAEAENLSGQFRGWTADARDIKVLLLAGIIHLYEPWGCHTTVDTLVWKSKLRETGPYGLGHPYFCAFYAMISAVSRLHSDLGFTVPVDFVFDEQGGLGEEALLFYNWMKGSLPPEGQAVLGSTPVFGDDKGVMPLQAADMLAWHARREGETREDERERPALALLMPDRRHVMTHMDAGAIDRIADGFGQIPNAKAMRDKASWRRVKSAIKDAMAAGWEPPESWRKG